MRPYRVYLYSTGRRHTYATRRRAVRAAYDDAQLLGLDDARYVIERRVGPIYLPAVTLFASERHDWSQLTEAVPA